eukprot:m.161560 g.161560  ORF g.161560 m.161560 type:complete len:721 (+) comp17068_c1_seq5:225-2387(+)
MARARDNGIVKVACVYEQGNFPPQLLKFEQAQPLVEIIKSVCEVWKIPNPVQYSFKAEDTKVYITEKNRVDLKDGVVLSLSLAPNIQAASYLTKLAGPEKLTALRALKDETQDATFSTKFQEKGGDQTLLNIIQELKGSPGEASLGHALSAYADLLVHRVVEFDTLPPNFMEMVVGFTKSDRQVDQSVICSALKICAAYVTSSRRGYDTIKRSLLLQDIVQRAKSGSPAIQENALRLINNIISQSLESDRYAVFQEVERCGILGAFTSIVRSDTLSDPQKRVITPALSRELYVYQQLSLNKLLARINTPFSTSDLKSMNDLKSLRDSLPDLQEDFASPTKGHAGMEVEYARKHRKLGFPTPKHPEEDLRQPPGVLSLDLMTQFANKYTKAFTELVLDQMKEEYSFPFARASIGLTRVLIDLLHIGQDPATETRSFLPLFYLQGDFVNELFSLGVQLMSRTWREMEAKLVDFDKVLSVLRRQLGPALESNAVAIDILKLPSFNEIMNAEMRNFQDHEARAMETETLKQLRSKVRTETETLVKAQRLAHMRDGAFFYAVQKGKVRKEKFFAYLAGNHKSLHWGDPMADDQNKHTTHTCLVTEIKVLYIGAETPFLSKAKKNDESVKYSFGILGDNEIQECLEFVAVTPRQASMWRDGMRILTNKQCEEDEFKEDVENLVNLEMGIRMLNLQGVELSGRAPTVPNPPSDWGFFYQVSDEDSFA